MAQNAIRIKRLDGTWQDIVIQGPMCPSGPTGPAGPTGPTGPAGSGATGPAGGDLAGTYPNPTVKRMVGDLVDFRTTGARAGSGGSVPSGTQFIDSGASPRQIVYTTPSFPTRARISWQSRWDATVAAWHFNLAGLAISPAPVADYGPLYVSGACLWGRMIFNTYLGGASYFNPSGTFFADLAASTTYTFMHAMYPGQSAHVWDASMPLSLINLEVFAR